MLFSAVRGTPLESMLCLLCESIRHVGTCDAFGRRACELVPAPATCWQDFRCAPEGPELPESKQLDFRVSKGMAQRGDYSKVRVTLIGSERRKAVEEKFDYEGEFKY